MRTMNDKKNLTTLLQEIENNCSGTVAFPGEQIDQTSAVLIPLVEHDGEICLVYEQRADKLRAQPGEICFPGGRLEQGEHAVAAAVRETCEELLVRPEQVRLTGRLDAVQGPAGAPVWPIIGSLEDYRGTWSDDEVERVLYVPLRELARTPARQYTTWQVTEPAEDFPFDLIPGGRQYPWRRKKHLITFYETSQGLIWGLTGNITYDFLHKINTRAYE